VFRENGKALVSEGTLSMPHAHTVSVDPERIWFISLCKMSTAILFCGSWRRAKLTDSWKMNHLMPGFGTQFAVQKR
jgi:hypothetical protein